jgi:hypothetical protein
VYVCMCAMHLEDSKHQMFMPEILLLSTVGIALSELEVPVYNILLNCFEGWSTSVELCRAVVAKLCMVIWHHTYLALRTLSSRGPRSF